MSPTTVIARKPWMFRASFFVAVMGALLMYLGALANGPDLDLTFSRDVPSDLATVQLAPAIDQVSNWPTWFFSATSAVLLDDDGTPAKTPKIIAGQSRVRLTIDPHGNHRHKFDLTLRVLDYTPGLKLRLLVAGDSTARLPRQFENLEWTIELAKSPAGTDARTVIHGTESAHTHNWRSRMFGRMATRTLMNQVFYPDLLGLAKSGNLKNMDLFPSGGG